MNTSTTITVAAQAAMDVANAAVHAAHEAYEKACAVATSADRRLSDLRIRAIAAQQDAADAAQRAAAAVAEANEAEAFANKMSDACDAANVALEKAYEADDAAHDATQWVPACGGTETPFTCLGKMYHYMWNRRTGEHAYYDIRADLFVSVEDFRAMLHHSK